MTELTRRGILGSAVAASAATALTPFAGSAVQAAAPPVGKQAPSFYRYKIGSIEVTSIADGLRSAPVPDNFVRNQPKEAVHAALAGLYMDKDRGLSPFNVAVVNTGSKLVLIDTGLGPATYAQTKGVLGQVHTNLAAAGISLDAIDTVVISHFHGDHINGLLTADSKPAFAKAEIMVPATEWAYWSDAGNASKAAGTPLEGNFKNVQRVFGALGNKVTQYDAGKEIVSGITSVATPGHTPGHTSHVVASGNSKVLIQADVTAAIGILFVRNPGWHAIFDMDGAVAEQTRRKTYDMAASEKMMIQGFHWSFPGLGYVEKDGTGYRLAQAPWSPTI